MRPPRRGSTLVIARCALILSSAPLVASAPDAARTGLLVVAHGADSGWNALVRETVAQVRWPQGPVAVAFLMAKDSEASSWDSALAGLVRGRATSVIAVPLLVSSHSAHYREIEADAGLVRAPSDDSMMSMDGRHSMAGRAPPVPVVLTPALDSAPELGAAVAARWAAQGTVDRRRPLVLIAHGPNDDGEAQQWIADLTATAVPALRAAGFSQRVWIGLLRDDAPPPVRALAIQVIRDTIAQFAVAASDSVLVLPILISSGTINAVRIPRDLEALPVRYVATSLAPLTVLARWIERVASEAARASGATTDMRGRTP